VILFRFVKRIFLFLFFVFLISFGISNKELLYINLWPFSFKLQIPAYLFFFVSLFIGVMITSIYGFLNKRK
tara:strand:+ start:1708 stop:1920 length:213 start_codon:yes stop_codon:yes gene_type:complete